MASKILFPTLALSFLAASAANAAPAACQLQKVGELPIVMQNGRPTTTVSINGQQVTVFVESGDSTSMVSTEAGKRLGMTFKMAPPGLRVRGFGGDAQYAQMARAKDFSILGMDFHGADFLVGDRVGGKIAAGAIGQNVLGAVDVEYDLAHGVIRLFEPKGCSDANMAYWAEGKAVSRLSMNGPGVNLSSVMTSARIDGHSIRVKFSSGAAVSYLSKPAAARAGIKASSEGVVAAGVTQGLFGKGIETSIAPFDSFAIGDEEIKNTRLRIADIDNPNADMLLGADFFLSHRIFVSKSQNRLYFTYNGGPVFRLDGPPAGQQQAQADGAPAPAAAGAPSTADDYARLGAALVARRDFPAAIADFTKAIELEPNNGARYFERASARLNASQRVLAMADLDEALKRQPANVQALMMRGELLAQSKDTARATADFEAAMAAAPENKNLPIRAAAAYSRGGSYDRAIRLYDAWLAAHPKDDQLGQVLNARCNARSNSGQQLDAALADCDAALKHGDRVSTAMENRGVVLLRMGRLDESIKQFDAAIREQPKAAWALYMRGLAEQRKGMAAQSEADIAAAVAIRPNVALEAQRVGLARQGAEPVKS